MAQLQILEFPDPRLRTKAQPVSVFDAALKQLVDGLNAAKARVAVKRRPVDPRAVTRLRQDPKTGIYYPDA